MLQRRILRAPFNRIARRRMRIPRSRLYCWRPEWDADSPFRLWATKFVNGNGSTKGNYWRVKHILTEDEALSECAVVFSHCRHRYFATVVVPKHFMALFKTSVNRRWNTLARQDEQQRNMFDYDTEVTGLYSDDDRQSFIEPFEDSSSMLVVAVNELPNEVRLVLDSLLEAPAELLTMLFTPLRTPNGVPKPASGKLHDLTIDIWLRYLYGLTPRCKKSVNIIERLRELCNFSH